MTMRQHLIIQLEQTPGRAAWLPADAEGRPLGMMQSGELADAASMAGERRVVVLVPSEHVLMARADLPHGLGSAQSLKAVPYSLEDRLAEDVDAMHFAIGDPRGTSGTVPVAAVSHACMSSWLSGLAAAGISPSALVPDCLALPWSPGQATVAAYGGRTLCRDGACDGFTAESESFEAMYAARVRDGGEEPERRHLSDEGGLLAALAPGAVTAPVNLLQGVYRQRTEGSLGHWRLPAALAAALVLLMGAHWLSGYISLAREHDRVRAMIEEAFSEALPGEPMVDARAQISRRLGDAGAGDGEWLRMLDALSGAVPQVPGVELQSINWRPGAMEVSITAQRADQLDALRSRIVDAGQDASIESASSRGDRVDGRLRIRGGG